MTRGVLVILGGGTMQLAAIDTAKRIGCRVLVLDPRPDAPGAAKADWFHAVDLGDVEACLKHARAYDASGVVTAAADYPVPTVAAICQALQLPGLTPASARAATDKFEMRTALRTAGVPVPRFALCQSENEASRLTADYTDSLILKPADSSGGRGVITLGPNPSSDEVVRGYRYASDHSRSKRVLVETLVEGPEVSVEAITVNGTTHICAVTDKYTTGRPYWVEVAHSQPSEKSHQVMADIERATRQSIAALGIDQSASHTEIKLTKDGPVVIEVGGRLGGGFITSDLVPLSTGIDLVAAAIQVALGQDPDLRQRSQRGAAVRFLMAQGGVVESISGVSAAERIAGVVRVTLEATPGDRIPPLTDATGRVGHVIAKAATAQKARAVAEHAVAMVHVDTAETNTDGTLNEGLTQESC
jgi:biotin carboxylase